MGFCLFGGVVSFGFFVIVVVFCLFLFRSYFVF